MLFTAIGFHKPVLISPEINPEVLDQYSIGMTLNLTSQETIVQGLQEFIDIISNRPDIFKKALTTANLTYSQERLIKETLGV